MSTLSLPRLAKGGIVDGATPFIAGEQGKEAIVPLERNTEWVGMVGAEIANIISQPITDLTQAIGSMQVPKESVGNYSYNTIVEAFKDALAQMKIVLDDEQLGDFVEKTVADAIFT